VLKIVQVETDEHRRHVRELFWEYLRWANSMLNREFGISFDIKSMLEQDMVELDKFLPPEGRLLLGQYDHQIAGIACMKKIGEGIGEVKRMYVRPEYRRKGIGRALLEAVIKEARQIGYSNIRLDSTRFMKEAHALYRSVGFQDIEPYPESEIPEEYRSHWVFMEMALN
jgi:GNAT superfamily N-acetyltransferase